MRALVRRVGAVLWDVDGVLIDSEPLHWEALSAACDAYGCPISAEENASLLGRSVEAVWDWLRARRGLLAPRAAFVERIVDHYVRRVDARLARAGVVRCIGELARRGVPQACVSTAERRIVDANLGVLGIAGAIRFSISREDVELTKPDPAPYLLGCARLGLAPAHCMAVEDTQIGIESAARAGLVTVAWPHAMSSGQSFERADHRIAGLDEIPWNLIGPRGAATPA